MSSPRNLKNSTTTTEKTLWTKHSLRSINAEQLKLIFITYFALEHAALFLTIDSSLYKFLDHLVKAPKLLRHILRGDEPIVKAMIIQNPSLLKIKASAMDYSGGCDFCLVPVQPTAEELEVNRLFLSTLDDKFKYSVKDAAGRIYQGEVIQGKGNRTLTKSQASVLKNLFNKYLMPVELKKILHIFSTDRNDSVTAEEKTAVLALFAITSNRGHSHFGRNIQMTPSQAAVWCRDSYIRKQLECTWLKYLPEETKKGELHQQLDLLAQTPVYNIALLTDDEKEFKEQTLYLRKIRNEASNEEVLEYKVRSVEGDNIHNGIINERELEHPIEATIEIGLAQVNADLKEFALRAPAIKKVTAMRKHTLGYGPRVEGDSVLSINQAFNREVMGGNPTWTALESLWVEMKWQQRYYPTVLWNKLCRPHTYWEYQREHATTPFSNWVFKQGHLLWGQVDSEAMSLPRNLILASMSDSKNYSFVPFASSHSGFGFTYGIIHGTYYLPYGYANVTPWAGYSHYKDWWVQKLDIIKVDCKLENEHFEKESIAALLQMKERFKPSEELTSIVEQSKRLELFRKIYTALFAAQSSFFKTDFLKNNESLSNAPLEKAIAVSYNREVKKAWELSKQFINEPDPMADRKLFSEIYLHTFDHSRLFSRAVVDNQVFYFSNTLHTYLAEKHQGLVPEKDASLNTRTAIINQAMRM